MEANAVLVVHTGQGALDVLGFRPDAVVLDGDFGVAVGVHDGDLEVAGPTARLQAVMDRVLHQGLEDEGRQHHTQHLGGHAQGDLQPFAEAGPLQVEIGVDQTELLGHRHELPVAPEAVTDEVRELDQELTSAVRIGADE